MPHPEPRPPRKPLRERMREEGGWFSWMNAVLIRKAGPAAVGPYDTEPEPERSSRDDEAEEQSGHDHCLP